MKKFPLILIILCFFTFTQISMAQENEIIYFGDPMCSWCYGFSDEIIELKDALPELKFTVVLGGLRPNGTEKITDLADFLKEHWEEIGEMTGQKFKYDILKDKDFIYNTEPACRAVVAVRKLKPEKELAFFKAIQKSFYADNVNTTKEESFIKPANDIGISEEDFSETFNDPNIINETINDFIYAQNLGVTGFPSIVLKKGEEMFLISSGYKKASDMLEVIRKTLTE